LSFLYLTFGCKLVISGYNTDIEFNGVVYHVQTEDKGPAMPIILSLVYDRGTILASKRAPYDFAQDELDEDVLAERLQRQHKLICAAVMAGRIDDLKRMSAAAREHRRAAEPGFKEAEPPTETPNRTLDSNAVPEPRISVLSQGDIQPESQRVAVSIVESPIPMPDRLPLPEVATLEETELTVLDDVKVLEEYSFLSPEDLKIVSDLAGQVRPEHDNLSVEFVGAPEFRGGKTVPVFILVCRGSRREVVRGTEIMVKILGTGFRPVIYHAVSDKNGLAQINVTVPSFSSGRATILARAKNGNDEIEIRRPVLHG
jgi:hypothetical protein